MATALLKNSATAIRKEVAYGTDPGSLTKANAIELSGTPEFNNTYDSIERDIVRKSFSSYAAIRGLQTTSGNFGFELHGSGTHGTSPETDVAWECAMGYKITGASEAVTGAGTSAPYATSLFKITVPVADGDEESFTVGRAVVIYRTTTIIGTGFVSSTDNVGEVELITKTNFSASLKAGDIMSEGTVYSLTDAAGAVGELPSCTIDFWRGDITRENYTGNIVTGLDIDMTAGQIIVPKISWEGKTVAFTASNFNTDAATGTLEYDSNITSPLIARSVDLIITSGTTRFTFPVTTLSISVQNSIAKKESIDTEGVFEVTRIGRAVSGTLNTFYEGLDFQTAFKNENTYELRVIAGDNLGNMFTMSAPKLKFSEIPLSEDTGMFKYNASFTLEPINGDDELVVQFL